ncbi:MAG TPA: LPS assembly protein LptD [Pyrinomonadaceae bacterium]|nr:LPS assembly protein LptD [Pyrinomonadaceae bacterium]
MRLHKPFICSLLALIVSFTAVFGQQTNPVERKIANPVTDTPNVNPVGQDPDIRLAGRPQKVDAKTEGGDDEVVVYSDNQSVEGEEGKRVLIHSGNVDVRYGIYRLQADKVTIYEAENRLLAEGSVVFDQGNDQRITGSKADWNYKTKLGKFVNSTGFTNQTNDGSVIYFTADLVERVGLNEVVVTNGKFTACEEAVPKWSFTADEARIKTNETVKLKNAKFKVNDVTLLPMPYVSIPIRKTDRKSGFLTPTFGFSPNKGLRVSAAYFKTLGKSADVTFRGDIYSSRGIGYGLDFRSRANSRSYFNFGFFAVKDRIFGAKASPDHPDQGGSIVYAEGVHYFQNGFTAAADVRLTSNLAFRQVFSDGIQQIISPIEVSQAFINKSWNNYTLNLLARSQVISIPNVRIKTRNLPSINFEKRPSRISFLKNVYFSFKTSLEGVSRREDVDNLDLYRSRVGRDPLVSPVIGQRFDIHPIVEMPIDTKYATFTLRAGTRVTYYSNSFNDMRLLVGRDVIRKYGEFEFDVRPVALARNFYGKNNQFLFRHVIEPFVTYRLVKGVDNFNRIIRFDYQDTATDTNELEFGITNRFYTRRFPEAVTEEAKRRLAENPDASKNPLSVQPYEIFTLTVRGKYFFDKTFGGALIPGQRNQINSITDLTFYTFGGVPRRFSPLNVDLTYRPRKTIFWNSRMDVGIQGDGLRAISTTVGYDTDFVKLFQTFYYTRGVTLKGGLAQYADANGKEAGTLRGSQWSPSIFLGNRDRGLYGGSSLFFDFQNRRASKDSPLISSLFTLGYAYDCCSVAAQYYTFNVGARRENRLVFSFRLNGIGAFGTEQFGQGLR